MSPIEEILNKYKGNFSDKVYSEDNQDEDILMKTFGITSETKSENKQYWGRELGMVFQNIVKELFKEKCPNEYKGPLQIKNDDGNTDEPCDLFYGNQAIDTKYRIGSGDSGTLKKFRKYAEYLKKEGHEPVLLILRDDNLENAINSCRKGGWTVLTGEDTLSYIEEKTGVNLEDFLLEKEDEYHINR